MGASLEGKLRSRPRRLMTLYTAALLFLIWSFLGWAMEVCVHTIKMGKYSDRGFLNSPVCPIYGFGALILRIGLGGVADNIPLVFALSMVICTLFELIVGVAMRKLFNNIWWDYTDEKFNFHGYICLKVSLEWGLLGTVGICGAVPLTEKIISLLPRTLGLTLIFTGGTLLIIDTIASVAAVNRFNLKLKEITEITDLMYEKAEEMGLSLGTAALGAQELGHDAEAGVYLAADEISGRAKGLIDGITADVTEKQEKHREKMQKRADVYAAFTKHSMKRFINAFPGLRSIEYNDALNKVREFLKADITSQDATK